MLLCNMRKYKSPRYLPQAVTRLLGAIAESFFFRSSSSGRTALELMKGKAAAGPVRCPYTDVSAAPGTAGGWPCCRLHSGRAGMPQRALPSPDRARWQQMRGGAAWYDALMP